MCFSRSTPDHSADHVDDENHDFFSGSRSSYMIGKALNPEDVDWDL
jgi:ribonucleotide reductase beta subunit family protein with ferritin-like domain